MAPGREQTVGARPSGRGAAVPAVSSRGAVVSAVSGRGAVVSAISGRGAAVSAVSGRGAVGMTIPSRGAAGRRGVPRPRMGGSQNGPFRGGPSQLKQAISPGWIRNGRGLSCNGGLSPGVAGCGFPSFVVLSQCGRGCGRTARQG